MMKWIKNNLEYVVVGTLIAVVVGLFILMIYAIATENHASAAEMEYSPAAYGQNGQCYYVNNPAEAIALQQAGRCPSYWVPTIMPVYWHETYFLYYGSPRYYDHFVGASYRTTYINEVHTFETVHRTEIVQRQNSATWKGSDGKTVDGKTVANQVKSGQTSFNGTSSSGSSQTTTNKSNPAPVNKPAAPAPAVKPAAPAPPAAKTGK